MDLSVSIVSWNTRDLLDACLTSVYETTQGVEFEVIVVDNASSDGSAEMVRSEYPWVRLIENEENVGFSRANNQAFAASSGRYFMLLNSDTVCHDGSLEGLVRFLDSVPSAGAAGPMVLNSDGSLQPSWARFPTLIDEVMGRLDRRISGVAIVPKTRAEVVRVGSFLTDWIGGCAMVVRREAIDAVGPMDESLFMYCEETDWCMRLKSAGWQVWVEPAAELIHLGGQSSKQMPDEAARALRRSKAAFFAKHRGCVQAYVLRAALEAKSMIKRSLPWLRSGSEGTR